MPAPPDAAEAAHTVRDAGEAAGRGPGEGTNQGNAAHPAPTDTGGTSASDAARDPDYGARPDHPAPTAADGNGTGSIAVVQDGTAAAVERAAASSTASNAAVNTAAAEAVPAPSLGGGDMAEREATPSAASDASDDETAAEAASATLADEGNESERGAILSAASETATDTPAADAESAALSVDVGGAECEAIPSAASDADAAAAAEAALTAIAAEGDAAGCEAPPSAASDAADDVAAAEPASAPPPAETDAPEAPADPALFAHALRIAEALVFASDRPVTPARLGGALPPGCDPRAVLTALSAACAGRPVELVEVAGGFSFRTAPELAPAITRVVEAPRRLPRAAMETLAIVAYHQPVTRAEIEEIRGASLSQSTLELLLDAALIAPRGRKEVPGRPSLWGTTPRFLEQFGLKALGDLPRREELVNEPTLPLAPLPPTTDATPPPAA